MVVEIRIVVTFEGVAIGKGIRWRLSGVLAKFFYLEGVRSFCNNSLSCTFMIWILFVNPILHCKVYLKTKGWK